MNTILLSAQFSRVNRALPACPYRGLMPYTEDDAEFFFGRDRDMRLIIDNLKAYRVTVLYGDSGVGKSSVLRAGVLQRMNAAEEESLETFDERESVVVYCNNWRDDPLAALADRVRDEFSTAFPNEKFPTTDWLDAAALGEICESLPTDVYLVLDQFDEYFLYHADDLSDGDFPAVLAGLITSCVRVNILIAIREDALARLDRFKGKLPRLFDNMLRLDHLDHESARQAVVEPLRRYNGLVSSADRMEIESKLVDQVLEQVRAGRVRVGPASDEEMVNEELAGDQLRIEAPFLQLVMTRIWAAERGERSSWLRVETLTELGGAEAIVRDHMDLVLDHLVPTDKALIAAAFRYLVTPSGTKIAHTPTDLAASAEVDKAAMWRLLRMLSTGDQHIFREVPPPLDAAHPLDEDPESRYELFHDVLALAALKWRRRYDAEQRRQELVRARRRLHRSRAVAAVLAVLVVLCLILGLAAYHQQGKAEQKTSLAKSAGLLSTDPQAAAAAGLLALQQGGGDEADKALRLALSQPRPTMTLMTGSGSGEARWTEMSPQGDLVAAAYHDGNARLWDVDSREVRYTLQAGKASGSATTQVRFSKDGSLVVTSSDDGRARVFRTRDGLLLHELGQYHSSVVAVPGMAGGRNIVLTWALNEDPAVWDARTGQLLASVKFPVHVAALSADGTRVAVGARDGRLRVWTWAGNGNVVIDPRTYVDFSDIAFCSRDPNVVLSLDRTTGNLIQWHVGGSRPSEVLANNQFLERATSITQTRADVLAMTAGKEVRILNSATGKTTQVLSHGDDKVTTLAFSPDGGYVARGDNDGTIRVFPVHDETLETPPLWVLLGHTGAVQSLAFSHDGARLMSAAADGSVRVWEVPARVLARSTSRGISDARFSADGRIIVSGDSDQISTADAQGGPPRSFGWRSTVLERLGSVAVSPDGSSAVVASPQSRTPQVFELPGGHDRQIVFKGQTTHYLTRADYSPDPAHPSIVVANQGGGLEMLDVATGDLLWSQLANDSRSKVLDVRFSADGSAVATASQDGVVMLFDAVSGRRLGVVRQAAPVTAVAFTTDGRYLATYAEDRQIRVWRTADFVNGPVEEVGMPVRANGLAFSPDSSSKFLAVAGSDGRIAVYRWEGRLKPLAILRQHSASVTAVQFDPRQPADGPPRLMSAGEDGTVALYSCELCSVGDRQLEQYAKAHI